MNKTIVIALFGKSGAGKDTIQKELLKYMNNSKGIISNTTRPPREYERNGIDYHFLSVSNFIKKITRMGKNKLFLQMRFLSCRKCHFLRIFQLKQRRVGIW